MKFNNNFIIYLVPHLHPTTLLLSEYSHAYNLNMNNKISIHYYHYIIFTYDFKLEKRIFYIHLNQKEFLIKKSHLKTHHLK